MPLHVIVRDFGSEQPLSQMNRPLTERELNGSLSREYGLLPSRTLQVGSAFVSNRGHHHVAFVHPPLRSSAPMPSARRAAPRRPESCA